MTRPQEHAHYVRVLQGAQSSASADVMLPGLANDSHQPNAAPPGLYSPNECANSAVNDGSDSS